MTYRFRLLGPVEVATAPDTAEGRAVTAGPPKRRAMLAALLLPPNQPVPLARLVSAMWASDAPTSAVANVRSHASALRRLLAGQQLGDRLLVRPGAYEVRADDDEVDAVAFARLARAGREALTAGEYATAIARLGAALALWRGAAGGGVPPGTTLEAPLAALDAQRYDVLEDYAEARWHTRAYGEIAAELRHLLATRPDRERAWALLIRTLYADGNAAGALDAYAEARRHLQEQLGIEPGRPLQELHRRVLNRDPALDDPVQETPARDRPAPDAPAAPERHRAVLASPTLAQTGVGMSTPRSLPPDPEILVGRDPELAALQVALRNGDGAVVLAGRRGSGTTTLAVRAAHRTADAFPDGQVFVTLPASPPPTPHEVVRAVLAALGADSPTAAATTSATVAPADRGPAGAVTADAVAADAVVAEAAPAELTAAYHARTAGRRLLVVVDGVAHTSQLLPLLASHTGATLLATTARRLAGTPGTRPVTLAPLSEAASAEVLTAYAGGARTIGDETALGTLVRLCDGLPLALRIVGERLARRPELPATLLATHLANRPLDGLRLGGLSVRDALAADHAAAAAEDPLAGTVFPLLGRISPGETTTPEALAPEVSADPSRVFYALEHLVDAWLAESPAPGRYRTAGLPRAYAHELDPSGEEVIEQPNAP